MQTTIFMTIVTCNCCGKDVDDDDASHDKALNGPVCLPCEGDLANAAHAMHGQGIRRIFRGPCHDNTNTPTA